MAKIWGPKLSTPSSVFKTCGNLWLTTKSSQTSWLEAAVGGVKLSPLVTQNRVDHDAVSTLINRGSWEQTKGHVDGPQEQPVKNIKARWRLTGRDMIMTSTASSPQPL
jgi:hypothetical protein